LIDFSRDSDSEGHAAKETISLYNFAMTNEGQWEDRKQWSLGVGQRRKPF